MGVDLHPADNKIAHSCCGSFIACGCGFILMASVYTLVPFIHLVILPADLSCLSTSCTSVNTSQKVKLEYATLYVHVHKRQCTDTYSSSYSAVELRPQHNHSDTLGPQSQSQVTFL